MTHKHSGPETWYLLSGEQCLELPDRALRARVGEIHDSSKPFNTFLDWNPRGLCQ